MKSYLYVVVFIIYFLTFLLLRRNMIAKSREGGKTTVEKNNVVPVKIEKGETVTIELKSLEDYEKEFGRGNLVPLWDGRLSSKGYVVVFDSTTEKNCFSLGEYVALSSLWDDSNYVKIDFKDNDAKFLVVPAAS